VALGTLTRWFCRRWLKQRWLQQWSQYYQTKV